MDPLIKRPSERGSVGPDAAHITTSFRRLPSQFVLIWLAVQSQTYAKRGDGCRLLAKNAPYRIRAMDASLCHPHWVPHISSLRAYKTKLTPYNAFRANTSMAPLANERTPSGDQVHSRGASPWWIPKFLVTPTLRLYCLRAIVILSAILTWYSITVYQHGAEDRPTYLIIGIVIAFFVFFHHLGTYVKFSLLCIPSTDSNTLHQGLSVHASFPCPLFLIVSYMHAKS